MRDIAALIDEPHSWIGKIETAERRLDIFEYVKYCEVLGVKPAKGLRVSVRVTAPVDCHYNV